MHLVLRVIVLAVSACCSFFFSGSETAFFSLPVDEVKRMGESGGVGAVIAGLLSKPKRFLTTVLFGNMVVNVMFYSVSFLLIVEHHDTLGPEATAALSFGSFLFVVIFCELLPKNIAVTFARPVCLLTAYPLFMFQKVFFPVIFALEKLTDFISRIFGRHGHSEQFVRAEELHMLIDMSERDGALEEDVGEMIAEVVRISEKSVREVMVPRVEMICFDIDDPPEALEKLFCGSKHTLIPVYEQRVDNALGVVHAEDFLIRDPAVPLRDIVRPIPFVPESVTVESVLQRLREQHSGMAFIVDEYGAVAGIVTVEDLLEQIVGEIGDEFDADEAPFVQSIDEGRFRLRGDLSVRQWHEAFAMEPTELSVDTIGGLVMTLLERVPQPGDRVRYRNLNLTVEKVHGRRVISVILELAPEGEEADD
jgi:CBS domain containing-hemolysin-like protein